MHVTGRSFVACCSASGSSTPSSVMRSITRSRSSSMTVVSPCPVCVVSPSRVSRRSRMGTQDRRLVTVASAIAPGPAQKSLRFRPLEHSVLAVQEAPQLVDGQRLLDSQDSRLEGDGAHRVCEPRWAIGQAPLLSLGWSPHHRTRVPLLSGYCHHSRASWSSLWLSARWTRLSTERPWSSRM